MSSQAPASVVMVRPRFFRPNAQTADDNAFQSQAHLPAREIAARAYDEVSVAAEKLRGAGVTVHVFEDERDDRPDSVFPNNWFSTHPGGSAAVFPMYAQNRRTERRSDILDFLKHRYRLTSIVDYSGYERDGRALEGTGAMVIDHINRVVYATRSHRMDRSLLERFCGDFTYEPFVFDAADRHGTAVYHTNVLMCIATDFALAGLDLVTDATRRGELRDLLGSRGRRTVLSLSEEQIKDYAGNAIELQGTDRRILALSGRAERSLHPDQIEIISRSCEIVSVDIPTIELAGGSLRCMIAGVHLSPVTPQPQAISTSRSATSEGGT